MDQTLIDALSDGLKRAAVPAQRLPETEIAAWFFNLRDGPQFWTGVLHVEAKSLRTAQPLYLNPAREGQEPVAWMAQNGYPIITQDRSAYRSDLEWKPLYLAR